MPEKSQKTRSLKVEISEALWYRLNYYSRTTEVTPEEATSRLLERYLPDLTGGLIRFLETLSAKEQQTLKQSFYHLMFLVAYADQNVSFKETLEAEKQLKLMEEVFGEVFIQLLELPKEKQQELLEAVHKYDIYEVLFELIEIERIFNKMPDTLREEYKKVLSHAMFKVASASKDSFLGDRVSADEKRMLCCVLYILDMPLLEEFRELLNTEFLNLLHYRHKIKLGLS